MYSPIALSGEDAKASWPRNGASIELPSRRRGTIEEDGSDSFEDTRNTTTDDERMGFVTPSISNVPKQQTIIAAPGLTDPPSTSQQHLLKNETASLLDGETSRQKEQSTLFHGGATAESVWAVWWAEIFSSVLALGCIITIIVVLYIYQEKPLPSWPKFISINTLIAVCTAIFKAALILPVAEGMAQLKWNWFDRSQKLGDLVLLDHASRGPWGSLLLIIKFITRQDKGYLAGLGALITIAALAVDPFSQAIIKHDYCEITANFGSAEVSRTNNYSGNPNQHLSPYGGTLVTLNQEMLRAIHRGLVDPPKAGELVHFSCTSGNCTFEQDGGGSYFSSLGICHSCADVTEKVVHKRVQGPRGPTSTWYLPWSKNATYETLFRGVPNGRLLIMTPTPLQAIQNSPPPIYSFDVLALTELDQQGKPFAAQCRIDPCVRKYSATISNGVYVEKVGGSPQLLKKRPLASNDSEEEYSFALLTDSVLIDGTERRCKEVGDKTHNSVQVGFENGMFQGIVEEYTRSFESKTMTWKYYPQECVWVVQRSSWVGMRATMAELLKGEINEAGRESGKFEWVQGSLWNKQVFAAGNASMSTVNNLVSGMASSMTATMRSNPYGTSEELASNASADLKVASGRVIATQTCIYVRWGWIAFPVALLLLQWLFSTVVLIACSQRTSPIVGAGRAVWKSSPLPLLFHGLDEDLRRRNQNLGTVKRMDSWADDITVRLVPMKDSSRTGWKFADA